MSSDRGRSSSLSDHTVAIVAHGQHALVALCLARVRQSGFSGALVLVDNGSDPPLEALARQHDARYVRHAQNRFVNPVWNELVAGTATARLTLLNSDCLVRDGYLDEAARLLDRPGLALVAPRALHTTDLARVDDLAAEREPPVLDATARRTGHAMTLDLGRYRRCRHQIPERFRLWFGDDWIWGQLRDHGYTAAVIENRTCHHQTSASHGDDAAIHAQAEKDKALARASFEMSRMCMLAGSLPPESRAPLLLRAGLPGRLLHGLWRWKQRRSSRE